MSSARHLFEVGLNVESSSTLSSLLTSGVAVGSSVVSTCRVYQHWCPARCRVLARRRELNARADESHDEVTAVSSIGIMLIPRACDAPCALAKDERNSGKAAVVTKWTVTKNREMYNASVDIRRVSGVLTVDIRKRDIIYLDVTLRTDWISMRNKIDHSNFTACEE